MLVSESFDQGVFNARVWNVTDPGSHLGFGALGLAMTGGTGLDGQTTLTAIDAVEMGGTLVVEAGSLVLATASDWRGMRVVFGCGFAGELFCGI